MVRLERSSGIKGEPRKGTNVHSIEKLLEGMQIDQRKRSRTVAGSLQYKIANPTGKYIIPPLFSQQPKTTETNTEQTRAPSTPSRARGSGIPPRKLDISDLEGMDEQQIMQALYDDPELAAQVEEAAKDASEKPGTSRLIKEPGDRVDLDKGLPYVQWIIVLVLLVAGLFQLCKTLSGPSTSKKGPASTKKIPKGKKTAPRMRGKGADKPLTKEDDDLVERVAAEIEGAVEGPKPKKKQSKKKNKSKAGAKPTAKAKTSQSPDKAATDESSTSAARPHLNGNNSATKGASTIPLDRPFVTQPVVEDDEKGWQTVGSSAAKSSSPAPAPAPSPSVSKENASPQQPAAEPAPLTETDASPQQPAAQPAPLTETVTSEAPKSANTTGKKKKKKTANATPAANTTPAADTVPAAETTPTGDTPAADTSAADTTTTNNNATKPAEIEPTNGDAALARQLQEEEDLIAPEHGEDEWAQVTKKKRSKA